MSLMAILVDDEEKNINIISPKLYCFREPKTCMQCPLSFSPVIYLDNDDDMLVQRRETALNVCHQMGCIAQGSQ